MTDDILHQVALTFVPQVGPVQIKILMDYFGSATEIFRASKKALLSIDYIGSLRAKSIREFNQWTRVEKELVFIEKFHIDPLFLTNSRYPQRLLNCVDPPSLLYYRGKADLNKTKIISIVGTRNNSSYGKAVTEELMVALAPQDVLVISGLAFGIDAIAHRAALKNAVPTVGVVAHGLDTIYPSEHARLAKEMIKAGGGILTEFPSGTQPDKHNFPRRNRIVAGISDVVLVVETASKGGSMITAQMANGYNRDVFAVPGRIGDSKSKGCNNLIDTNRAAIYTSPEQLMENLGWLTKKQEPKKQLDLFIELSEEERKVVSVLKEKEITMIDELVIHTGLSSSSIAAAILNLELQSVIRSLPGKQYKLV